MPTLLVIAPHPDDEILGAGGLMRTYARAGWEVVVLYLTDGEAGFPYTEGLAKQRRAEAVRSLQALTLDINARVRAMFAGLPDGHLSDKMLSVLNVIQAAVSGSDLVVAPGPDDTHADHAAANRAVAETWNGPSLFYRVHGDGPPASRVTTYDLTPADIEAKRRALAEHASQVPALWQNQFIRTKEVFAI